MRMQVKVYILISRFTDELEKMINEYIAEGWQLQGAVTSVIKDGETSFMATMVMEV